MVFFIFSFELWRLLKCRRRHVSRGWERDCNTLLLKGFYFTTSTWTTFSNPWENLFNLNFTKDVRQIEEQDLCHQNTLYWRRKGINTLHMQTFCKVANVYTSRLRLVLKLYKYNFSFTGCLLNIAYSLCIIYTTCFQCGTTAKTNNVQHYCSHDRQS